MPKEYKQLKDIKLEDILGLEDTFFKDECLGRLIECGFIEKEKPEWKEITFKNLAKIRSGVTLKRTVTHCGHEAIIHVLSDPYWTSWDETNPYLDHIFVVKIREGSGHGKRSGDDCEYSVNDLFNGSVYIKE